MKKYKRSEKCELVYVSVAWNILDKEQCKDFEFINSFPNKAGKIRECIRAIRLGINPQYSASVDTAFPPIHDHIEEATDEEAIDLLTS